MVKKSILIIITGGTITMKNYNDSIDISKELLANLKSSKLLVDYNLEYNVEIFSSIPSPKFSTQNMFSLAKFIEKKIADNIYSGFVIAHGTDTLEETSLFLELYFSNLQVPIILTGSMKPFLSPFFDGYDNIVSSVMVASNHQSIFYGVLVTFNNNIISSLHVSKFHSENIDSFKSINYPNVGFISDNKIFFEYKPVRFVLPRIKSLVDNVYIYKTFSGDLGNYLKNSQLLFDALVIEGFGNGNVPEFLLPHIKRFLSLQIPVAITTRVPKGFINNSYDYPGGGKNLSNIGCLFSSTFNSQKMRIFLVYLLSLKFNFKKIKEIFNKYN